MNETLKSLKSDCLAKSDWAVSCSTIYYAPKVWNSYFGIFGRNLKVLPLLWKLLNSFLKSRKLFSDEFCVREFKIVLIFLKSFVDTPYYNDYNVQFIISDGLCLAQFQSTVPAAPLHTKDLVMHLWLNLHNQASVYRLFWLNSHLLPPVWCHGALGYEQLSYEWLNRLVSTNKNKQTNQNMSSFNVLSENEKLHIIGKGQAVVSILL